MKFVAILCWLLVVVQAEILEEDSPVPNEVGLAPNDDISRSLLDSVKQGHFMRPIKGHFAYTDDDGQLFSIFYIADAYGYQAQGRLVKPFGHLPPE